MGRSISNSIAVIRKYRYPGMEAGTCERFHQENHRSRSGQVHGNENSACADRFIIVGEVKLPESQGGLEAI